MRAADGPDNDRRRGLITMAQANRLKPLRRQQQVYFVEILMIHCAVPMGSRLEPQG